MRKKEFQISKELEEKPSMTIVQYRRKQNIILIIIVLECLFNISVLVDSSKSTVSVDYLIPLLIFGIFYAGYRFYYLRSVSNKSELTKNEQKRFYEAEYRIMGIEAYSYLVILTVVTFAEFASGQGEWAILNLLMYGYAPAIRELYSELKTEIEQY